MNNIIYIKKEVIGEEPARLREQLEQVEADIGRFEKSRLRCKKFHEDGLIGLKGQLAARKSQLRLLESDKAKLGDRSSEVLDVEIAGLTAIVETLERQLQERETRYKEELAPIEAELSALSERKKQLQNDLEKELKKYVEIKLRD